MKRLCYSIVASFSGEHPDLSDPDLSEYWTCETTLSDVIRDWPGDKPSPSAPFDSEYSYIAKEGSIPKRILDRLDDSSGETRFQICRKLKERFPREAFWACISDIQVSGIFDRKTAFEFLDSIGARFEDVETMGTIGGPLGHWVPDFSFNVESQALIASIRVTPILCEERDGQWVPCAAPVESRWERIKAIFRNSDCYDIRRENAFS